jgi:hypothetical protein
MCEIHRAIQKYFLRLVAFVATFVVGIAAFQISFLVVVADQTTKSNTEYPHVALSQIPTETEADYYEISPCAGKFNYNVRRKWNRSGAIEVGVVNQRISCGILPEIPQGLNIGSGTILVEVLINEFGEVLEARIKNGTDLLNNSAHRAALRSKFTPVSLRGDPVKVRGTLFYKYSAERGVWLHKFPKYCS